MENLFNIATFLTSEGFRVNTDLLETNLINILILVFILVQFIGNSLATALTERKQKIIDSVADAEKSYEISKSRLDEANNQLAQTKIAIDKIVQELQLTKTNIIKTGADRICQEMLSQIQTSALTIVLEEQKLITQVKKQIITLAIRGVIFFLAQTFQDGPEHQFILNDIINHKIGVSLRGLSCERNKSFSAVFSDISPVAYPYAEALMVVAEAENSLDSVTEDINNIFDLLPNVDGWQEYFSNPQIDITAKKDFVKKVFGTKVNDITLKFLLLLVDRRRMSIFEDIIMVYWSVLLEKSKTIIVDVISFIPLSKGQEENLVGQMKLFLPTNPNFIELTLCRDTGILGGLVVVIGSEIIDFSYVGQLRNMLSYLGGDISIVN